MKEEISKYYKNKGFNHVYILTNKENRKIALLRGNHCKKLTLSYAKYLYTSFYEVEIDKDCHIDHINGDKTDDRIENLQIISAKYNVQKDHIKKQMVILTCPVCGKEFLFEKRNLSTHHNPCCSRKCGGIKSHWK